MPDDEVKFILQEEIMKKSIEKIISTALCVCIAASSVTVFAEDAAVKHPFSDVLEIEWYNADVQNVWEKEIIKGITDTEFQPQSTLTRAMVVTILGRLEGVKEEDYKESKFFDVDINEWYGRYVAWAAEKGIANGITEIEFAPNTPVTREQLAAFIQRYISKKGLAARGENSLGYKDADAVSSYARIAVSACKNLGIMQGDSEGNFAPANNTTRAEAAAVITRLEKYIAGYTYPVFNELDREKLATAIHAMNKSDFEGAELVKWIYQVAFSKAATLSGTPDEIINSVSDGRNAMVVPGLSSADSAEKISAEDFITGDILLIKNKAETKMYMFDGSDFVEMVKEYVYEDKLSASNAISQIKKAELYAVLRPSRVMTTMNYSAPESKLGLSEAQEALIGTAESYLRRGSRVQYDDGNMSPYGEYRWQQGVRAPEEYTVDHVRYTNCAAFCHDVYLYGLGYEIGMWTTRVMIDADDSIRPFYYEPTGNETDAEKAQIEQKFMQEIQPGDIIVYRYSGGGHAMFYAGNGNIIHSTGSTYSYAKMKEIYEPSIRYKQVKDLFTPEDSRYTFGGKVLKLALIRPLNTWKENVPQNTVNRVTTMRGIVAEKLSSHNECATVNPGEEMTFTFYVYNTNKEEAKLEITDIVPANTTYVSGAQTVKDGKLSWNITLPAGQYKEVSYTVRVDDNQELTKSGYIYGEDAKVGGVTVKCPKVLVKNTLTKEEQDKISKAANELKNSDMADFDKVIAIYKNALGIDNVLPGEKYEDIGEGVFKIDTEWNEPEYYQLGRHLLREDGTYARMVVPSCYGGRGVDGEPHGQRTRLLKEEHFMVGDILVARNINEKNMFIYTNEGLLDLNKGTIVEDSKTYLAGLQGLDNYDYYYVVLRPSMAIE